MALGQGKGQAKEAAAIYLAAFGKHPGWDDHIEDLGIETDLLAKVRQMLYTDAISGNIDSGAWEKLADEQRLPGFAHDFVWYIAPAGKDSSRVVVGRLWSSRDGKGRSKYPMAVYCEGVHIPLSTMAREVLPALAALERRCIEASNAGAVRTAIDETRQQLRARFARPDSTPQNQAPASVLTPAQVASLLDRPEMGPPTGPAREGFSRAMYAVEREMSAFLPVGGDGRRSKSLSVSVKAGEAKGAHLRLPALASDGAESALNWISLLSRRLAEGTSILAVVPRGEDFVDVVVGDPGAAQLYCVRASAKGFPLTTEVPYAIDDAYRAKVAEMAARWSGAAPATPAVVTPAAATASPAVAHSPAAESKKPSSLRNWFLGGGGAVIVVVAGALVMMNGKDKSKTASGPSTQVASANTGAGTSPPTATAPNPAPAANPAPSAPPAEQPKVAPPPPPPQPSAAEEAAKAQAQRQAEQAEREKLAREAQAREAQEKIALAEREKEAERDKQIERDKQAEREQIAQREKKAEQDKQAQREALAKKEAADQAKAQEQARLAQKQEADRLAAERQEKDRQAAVAAAEAKKSQEEADRLAAQKTQAQRAALESDLALASSMLEGGARWDDAAPDGRALSAIVDGVRASPAFAAVSSSAAAQGVTSAAADLGQISKSTDRDALLRHAQSPANGKLSAALLAAEQLAAQGWPGADQWSAAGPMVAGLRDASSRVSDPARAAAANARCAKIGQDLWKNHWKSIKAGDAASHQQAIAAMAGMGVDPSTLDAADRFDIMVVQIQAAAASSKDRAPALAQDFVKQAQQVQGLPPAASAQVAALIQAITPSQETPAGPSIDQLGPGSLAGPLRWSVQASGEDWVIFAPPAGSKITGPVEFVRLQTPAGQTYVQSREMSLGLFASLVSQGGNWPELAKLGRIDAKPSLNRRGPAVWEWDIAGGQLAGMKPGSMQNRESGRGWFDFDPYMAKSTYFEPGNEPASPSADSPIQYIAPAAALYAARLAGCRLPTVQDAAAMIARAPAANPNRRDASWMAAKDYLVKKGNGKNVTWLDGDIFIPADVQAPKRDKAVPAVDSDDGFPLLRPVNVPSEAHVIHDAIGNVAELVFEDSTPQESLPRENTGLREVMMKSTSLRVVGASAFSPPEVDPAKPYPVRADSAAAGFSDVGFRLAFDAKGAVAASKVNEQIQKAIEELKLTGK